MIPLRKHVQVQTIFSAFEPVYDEKFHYEGERHNFWELVYVVDGCAGVLEDDKIYELYPGEVIFHMPMEFHRLWAKKDEKLHLIVMSFSLSGEDVSFLGKGAFRLAPSEYAILREALDAICHCVEFDNDIKNQMISNNLERLILKLLEEHSESKNQKKTIGNSNYKNIIAVMNANLDKKLSIDEIAKLCNLSTSNLKKTFKKYSGMGVIEYFNNLKIAEAIKLLGEDVPVAQISEMLGYSSPSYFTDAFKRHCGSSPTNYRKEYRESEYYYEIIK